jgi:hypothetical protein
MNKNAQCEPTTSSRTQMRVIQRTNATAEPKSYLPCAHNANFARSTTHTHTHTYTPHTHRQNPTHTKNPHTHTHTHARCSHLFQISSVAHFGSNYSSNLRCQMMRAREMRSYPYRGNLIFDCVCAWVCVNSKMKTRRNSIFLSSLISISIIILMNSSPPIISTTTK